MLDIEVLTFVISGEVGGVDGILGFSRNEDVVVVGGIDEIYREVGGMHGMGGAVCRVGGV